jgi:hypothetical protein
VKKKYLADVIFPRDDMVGVKLHDGMMMVDGMYISKRYLKLLAVLVPGLVLAISSQPGRGLFLHLVTGFLDILH